MFFYLYKNKMSEIKIYLLDAPKDIYEKIFKEKGNDIEKNYGKIETKKYKNKSLSKSMEWIGYIYPKLSDDNIKDIFSDLLESFEKSTNKKNIIIKFGINYLKPLMKLSNSFTTDNPFMLFNFNENDKLESNFFDKFKYPQYVSYIKDKYDQKNSELNLHKIISYIWEKDCYYNERGNTSCNYTPANLLYKPSKGFIFFNILLIGESRAGKSTFINRMMNKYVTYETGKFESATQDITYYEFCWQDYIGESKTNELITNGYGVIRILDTPGIVKTENLDSSSKIIEAIEKEFKNGIHLIYFFMKGQSNIEQSIEILNYIKKKNSEKKSNEFKIPIIFIKNGEDLIDGGSGEVLFQELKKVLTNHDLLDLYDSFGKNEKELSKKKIDIIFDDEEEEDENNNYQSYIDGNIIQIHLPTGKNLNNLFLISKKYFIKNNGLILDDKLDDEYIAMQKNAETLVKLYIKENLEKKSLNKNEKNLYKKLYNECNEFVINLQNKASILFDLEILKVKSKPTISKALFNILSFISVWGMYNIALYFIVLPFLYLSAKAYMNNIISNIASSFGFNEKDIYHYGLDKYIFRDEFLEDISKNKEKSIEKIKKFFEDIIYYIGPIQCALKSRETIIQIKEIFENLSNKKDDEWNKFKVTKI